MGRRRSESGTWSCGLLGVAREERRDPVAASSLGSSERVKEEEESLSCSWQLLPAGGSREMPCSAALADGRCWG